MTSSGCWTAARPTTSVPRWPCTWTSSRCSRACWPCLASWAASGTDRIHQQKRLLREPFSLLLSPRPFRKPPRRDGSAGRPDDATPYPPATLRLLALAGGLLLAGCDKIPGLGPDPRIAQRDEEARAIGGACRH